VPRAAPFQEAAASGAVPKPPLASGVQEGLATCLRAVLGVAIGCVVWVWVRTLSIVVELPPRSPASRRVIAFLHGQQFALLAVRRCARTAVLVSQSKDGDIQAAVMRMLGFEVVRGSSSRGGARGLVELVRRVRGGLDAAFAVDGPRGPLGVPKPGAALTAHRAGVALVPVASASARKIVLRGAWDAFEIPWPFSRVAVVFGEPIRLATDSLRDASLLGAALADARARAELLATANHAALALEARR
jgi:lysophospholipid acyltransferase (LPLAT)-like uncharacterized protein